MTHGNYQKYTNPNPVQQRLIRNFLDAVAELVHATGVTTLLDVGCAEGFVSAHIRRQAPNITTWGLDRDVEALLRGRRLHPHIPTCVGDITQLPTKQGGADLVLCTEVLEHIPNPAHALHELLRASRRYVLLSVPWEPWFRLANVLRMKNLARLGDDPEHVNHWTGRQFRHFLRPHARVLIHRIAFPWQIVLLEKNQ